jgi:hypothetical protein
VFKSVHRINSRTCCSSFNRPQEIISNNNFSIPPPCPQCKEDFNGSSSPVNKYSQYSFSFLEILEPRIRIASPFESNPVLPIKE